MDLSVHESKIYCVHDHPFAYATLTDFGEGRGLLQVHSDWGTYSNFWSAMGDRKMVEFLASASPSYVEQKLQSQMNFMGCKKEAFVRLTKFMAHCWPNLKEAFKSQIHSGTEGKE